MHYAQPPILLHDVIGDLEPVRALLRSNAPYRPLGGWFRSGEAAAVPTQSLWFQNDWVHADLLVPGAELFLHNPKLAAAARAFYDAELIVPHTVYVNVMGPISAHGPAHTDNPVFRGLDRTNTPMAVLRAMLWSGLFEPWTITQATSIWWMNDVEGGAILYWPEGPAMPPSRHEGHMADTALVGDNHGMFHQVGPIGPAGAPAPLVTSHAELGPTDEGDWAVVDDERLVWRAPLDHYRVSVLWKAHVHADDAERRRVADDLLTLDEMVRIFNEDLSARDDSLQLSVETLAEPWVREGLRRAYPEAVPVGAG
jgi:hypothetical protein